MVPWRSLLVLPLVGCGVGEITLVQPPPSTPDASTPACRRRLEFVGNAQFSLAAGQQGDLTVLVRDECAGPVSDARVVFTSTGAPLGTQVAASALTDAAGLARGLVKAGATSGAFDVIAQHADAAPIAFHVTVTAGPPPCASHCSNGVADCGEAGVDCGGECVACPVPPNDDAVIVSLQIPPTLVCRATAAGTVTVHNSGTTTWTSAAGYKLGYVGDGAAPLLPAGAQPRVELPRAAAPGATIAFSVSLEAPAIPAAYDAKFQMVRTSFFGAIASSRVNVTAGCAASVGCSFPQGVPEPDFTGHADTSTAVGTRVNEVMEKLSGCSRGSDCFIGDRYGDQSWFAAVTAELRARGLCAGQHEVGHTDEIAVSNTGCTGLWYGYHVFFYGGQKVVWSPGAARGSWSIAPNHCPPP